MKNALKAWFYSMIGIILLLGSCTKKSELADRYEQASKPKPPKEFKSCDISRMVCLTPAGLITYDFEYNAKGDPLRINPSFVATGYPKYEFRYDHKGRLSDYIGPYNNNAFEFWHVYEYDDRDRMIRDTRYIFGDYGGEHPTPGYLPSMRVTTFEYEPGSTRVKYTVVYPYANMQPVVSYFDYSGNTTGGIENTVNVHRTSWVWMAITYDYTPRNPYLHTDYNEYGLPVKFNGPYGARILEFPSAVTIEYTCKGDAVN